MYENVTYESILQRMLDKIPNDCDKRESTVIYDALASAAVELQLMYIEFDIILKETFADTAGREYLIRRSKEKGIQPYSATYAVLKGEFTPTNLDIPIDTRFSCNEFNYRIINKITPGKYQLQCEQLGIEGNSNFGNMIPIQYINKLETAKLTELLIPGEDEESTEDLRKRYFKSFDVQTFGGNKKDYIERTNAIPGVGATKVTPVWDGGGTVLLTILDSNYGKASSALIQYVQREIDPTKAADGEGIAPIGHVVTVITADEVSVNLKVSLTFDNGYSFDDLIDQINNVISNYLYELRREWENNVSLIVRISQIESRILAIQGILDASNTFINGKGENLIIENNKIPIIGGILNG